MQQNIVILQKIIKNKLKIIKNINEELNFIFDTIFFIMRRLNDSHSKKLISQDKYNNNMNNIENVLKTFKKINNSITLKNFRNVMKIKIIKIVSKIKLKLIKISQKSGSSNIENLLKLIFNVNIKTLKKTNNSKFIDLLKFYNKMFCPMSHDMYSSSTNEISMTDEMLKYPVCINNDKMNNTLLEKLMGAKLYIPVNNELIVLNGYFFEDPLNLSKINNIFSDKNRKIYELIEKYNIPKSFKLAFIEQISIRDFIVNKETFLIEKCDKSYKMLSELKKKNISNIVKDFLVADIEKQIEIITLFLLNKDEIDTQYLVYLMYDMISNESYLLKPQPLAEQVFNSLHWSVQKLFKIAFKKIDRFGTNNFSEDKISYDKRIHLMKVPQNVKNKAFDKLKEINSSKGETNAKAQQYLDGILKIPFGNYKKEPIISFLDEFTNKIIIFCNYTIDLVKNNIFYDKICKICQNFLNDDEQTSKLIETFIVFVKNELENNSKKDIYDKLNYFNSLTVKKLKKLLGTIKISKQGNKNFLIDKIIKNYDLFNNKIKSNFKIPKSYLGKNEFNILIDKINELFNEYQKYILDRKNYLNYVDKCLNEAVYGLENSKLQIKRIIAQWINGNDTGYIFGFEGPAGTGKTTLAKKGIAKAIIDNKNKPRPFIFIALGGTSNGSTLEGHNYTYVGSTWGKIVDVLIETQCMNPIIYIDELDKVSKTEHGKEIIGILIHMTDPSQNDGFTDKYFSGVKIDISKCLIIFSYNDASLIDKILLDRIHRIKTEQLTRHDKIQIVNNYMLPDVLKSVGFNNNDIVINEDVLSYIIDTYTDEAGVRKLKEILFEIIREINLKYLIGNISKFPVQINKSMIKKLFSHKPKVHFKKISKTPLIGLVNGLYATSSGLGGITIIETFTYLSNKKLTLELTGQQGNVMKESMRVAKTVAWNLLPTSIKNDIIKNDPFGIHIHCPEAATPKDGPSAGVAITTAIYSLLVKIPVNNFCAITGEIDLNGKILAIGGLNLKIDGAKKAGIKMVLCPKENEEDLAKIRDGKNPPEDDNFKIILVENIREVLDIMLITSK